MSFLLFVLVCSISQKGEPQSIRKPNDGFINVFPNVYPNPTTGIFTISSSQAMES